MNHDLSSSRDENEHPFYMCEVSQMIDEFNCENDLFLGRIRVYYSLEKNQFEVILIHKSEFEIIDDNRIKYSPDLYKAPFFVMSEAHFNCIIFDVLKSWNVVQDYSSPIFPFTISREAIYNCPLLTPREISFHDLKDQVKKMHDKGILHTSV